MCLFALIIFLVACNSGDKKLVSSDQPKDENNTFEEVEIEEKEG